MNYTIGMEINPNNKNFIKLKSLLKRTRYSHKIEDSLAIKGDPKYFLPILNYSLLHYSPFIADFLLKNNYELFSKNDKEFVKLVILSMINLFNYKPCISLDEFFKMGFSERKSEMCWKIIEIVIKKHEQLEKTNKSLTEKRSKRNIVNTGSHCHNRSTDSQHCEPENSIGKGKSPENDMSRNYDTYDHYANERGYHEEEPLNADNDDYEYQNLNTFGDRDTNKAQYSGNQENEYNNKINEMNHLQYLNEQKNKWTEEPRSPDFGESENEISRSLKNDLHNKQVRTYKENEKDLIDTYIDDQEPIVQEKKLQPMNIENFDSKNSNAFNSHRSDNPDIRDLLEIIGSLAGSVKEMTGRVDDFKSKIETRLDNIEKEVFKIKEDHSNIQAENILLRNEVAILKKSKHTQHAQQKDDYSIKNHVNSNFNN